MGIYDRHILPRLIHLACGGDDIASYRAELLRDAKGVTLEIGFGSGTNLPHYPPTIEKLLIVEPSKTAIGLAQKAIRSASFAVEQVGTDGQQLTLANESVDTVVITFTLCTVEDVAQTLREAARVLKPKGTLLFLEHGCSDDKGTARWQNRLNGLQKKLCGGCHLNRKIDEAIEQSPLTLTCVKTFNLPGTPKTHGFLYQGKANKLAH